MGRISFVVYSRAAPQGSKTYLGQGRMKESSERVKPFRADVRRAAESAALPPDWPMAAPMRVGVRFHFARPKSHFKRDGVTLSKSAPEEATSHGLGDLDKLARSVNDALSGVLFNDDRQVVEMHLAKAYDSEDLVIISAEPLV
jgi:crossover junction endodeoxyribonuclease RusA